MANGGTMSALGTAESPISFTSARDDTLGGDSNGDGLSAPQNGDYWSALQVDAGSTSTIRRGVFQIWRPELKQ